VFAVSAVKHGLLALLKGQLWRTEWLTKSIRDAQGRLHKRDESLTIVGGLPRADFDTRPLLKVRLAGGSTRVVFSEEVEVSSARHACLVLIWIR
jgi:hypothetical protein